MAFNCNKCSKRYTTRQTLNDLLKREHSIDARKPKSTKYDCGHCSSTFNQCSSAFRHLREMHHSKKPSKCLYCPKIFAEHNSLPEHVSRKHDITLPKFDPEDVPNIQFQTQRHAKKKFFQSY